MYPSEVIPVADFPQFKKWLDADIDIVKFAIEETHKMGMEAFWEYRINGSDVDFSKASKDNRGWVMTPMKEKHPDWLMPSWPLPKWNFAIPGVREFKVKILRELAENYDFDGIELDFSRGPPSLRIGQAWQDRDAMTEFVKAVRLMFQEVAKKRGRPLLLAIRVPSTVPGCHYDGYDIERWAEENLVDIISPGDHSIDIDVVGFRRIIGDRNIQVIPSLDDYHATKGYKQYPIEFFRGVFSNWWHQGVDGIQTMNFHAVSSEFVNSNPEIKKIVGRYYATPAQEQSYHEIGDPEIMRLKDKMFVLSLRMFVESLQWGNNGGDFYQGLNCHAPLPVQVPADGLPTIQTLYISDDFNANTDRIKSIEMRILLTGAVENDIEVKLNGIKLPAPTKDKDWRKIKTTAEQFAVGDNLINVRLAKSADKTKRVDIEKLEVHVDYAD